MKHENKVRKMVHGRKEVWFDDATCVSKFINVYRDLFIKANWLSDENFRVSQFKLLDKDKAVYKLAFLMRYDDFEKIKTLLGIKRKDIVLDLHGEYKRNVYTCCWKRKTNN